MSFSFGWSWIATCSSAEVANKMENFDGENIDELLEIYQIHQYFPPSKFCIIRYSYFIPIAPAIIPFLFYCANDNITMHEWPCIIYIVTAALIEYLTVLLEYLNLFSEQSKH